MSGSKRLSIRAGTVLARNTFDTDLLPLDAIRLDAYCELNGIPLRFLPYRWQPSRSHDGAVTDAVERVYRDRYPARLGGRVTLDHVEKPPTMSIQWAVDVYETEPGGLHDTEDPFIAELYRKMIRDGWTGKEAREQLEYILRRDHNREHRKWLDRKRHTRAWVEAEFKLKYAKAEKRRTKEIVARGQRWIDNSIAQDKSFEAGEIAIGVPAIMPVVPKRSFMADVMDGAPEAMPKRCRTPAYDLAANGSGKRPISGRLLPLRYYYVTNDIPISAASCESRAGDFRFTSASETDVAIRSSPEGPEADVSEMPASEELWGLFFKLGTLLPARYFPLKASIRCRCWHADVGSEVA